MELHLVKVMVIHPHRARNNVHHPELLGCKDSLGLPVALPGEPPPASLPAAALGAAPCRLVQRVLLCLHWALAIPSQEDGWPGRRYPA